MVLFSKFALMQYVLIDCLICTDIKPYMTKHKMETFNLQSLLAVSHVGFIADVSQVYDEEGVRTLQAFIALTAVLCLCLSSAGLKILKRGRGSC